jgi:hypothetical protein
MNENFQPHNKHEVIPSAISMEELLTIQMIAAFNKYYNTSQELPEVQKPSESGDLDSNTRFANSYYKEKPLYPTLQHPEDEDTHGA